MTKGKLMEKLEDISDSQELVFVCIASNYCGNGAEFRSIEVDTIKKAPNETRILIRR